MNQPAFEPEKLEQNPGALGDPGRSPLAHGRGLEISELPAKPRSPLENIRYDQCAITWSAEKSWASEERQTRPTADVEVGKHVAIFNQIIFEAIRRGASDVKIGLEQGGLKVSFSIDGRMVPQKQITKEPLFPQDASGLLNRMKILGGMDIADRLHMQDGAARLNLTAPGLIEPLSYKLRLSTNTNINGGGIEGVMVRLLNCASPGQLHELLPIHTHHRLMELLALQDGMILCTGPTGHGKTTTLYSAINYLNDGSRNILTAEDPVEYEFSGNVWQVQMNRQAGIDFDTTLEKFLRQRPDVILVGEIRNPETLKMAIQAALTGHLVFSTVHTNDAVATITRLVDMGAERYLVKDCLQGVIAQRLAPCVCPGCSTKVEISVDQIHRIDPSYPAENGSFTARARGEGCDDCSGTGVRGRVGLYELLTVSKKIRTLIDEKADASMMRAEAIEEGMTTLQMEAAQKVMEGVISYEDACRAVGVLPHPGRVDMSPPEVH